MPRLIYGALALLALASPAFAYRPFLTEDAYVAELHHPELELGADQWRWRDGSHARQFLTTVNYGLFKRFELSLELPWLERGPAGTASASGPGDVTMASKLQLVEEGPRRPAFLLRTAVKLDSAPRNQGLGSRTTDGALVLAVSKELLPFRLHAALGETWVGGFTPGSRRFLYNYGLAADLGAARRLRLITEFFGSRHAFDDGQPDPVSAGLGFILPFGEDIALDAIARRGLSPSAAAWQVATGAFFAF